MQYPSGNNSASKVHYRPLEAAIRWSELEQHEQQILAALQHKATPDPDDFPQWPALHLNAERIFDALRNGDLPYGVNGAPAPAGTALDNPALTIRHVHLKAWMQHNYPDQRPSFLFSAFERSVHPVITIEEVRALTFERDSLKALLSERDAEIAALRLELRSLLRIIYAGTNQSSPPQPNSLGTSAGFQSSEADQSPDPETERLRAGLERRDQELHILRNKYNMLANSRRSKRGRARPDAEISSRAETTYQNIIGGFLKLMLGQSPAGQPYSTFRTQESIISAMIAHCGEHMGFSERTLHAKFAEGRRRLSGQ